MDLSRLIQEEIRRGATHQEIRELTSYLQSGQFNPQQFRTFLSTAADGGGSNLNASAHPPTSTSHHPPTPPSSTPIKPKSAALSKKGKKRKRAEEEGTDGTRDKVKKAAPEKRGAIFRKAPSRAIQERAERVKTQRMFLISRGGRTEVPTSKVAKPTPASAPAASESQIQNPLSESFEVLGSTGNCYTVTVCKNPSCTCPDFDKGNICKHLIFVYLRVLRIPEDLSFWYQKALLTSEVEFIFENAVEDPTTRVADHVKRAWERTNSGRTNSGRSGSADGITESDEGKRRIPVEGDSCPICFEAFTPGAVKGLTFCLQSCGNALHDSCFRSYAAARRTQGQKTTCVFCRRAFGQADDSGVAGVNSEGYLNLAAAAGLSTIRDTSSYYHGPRAGERYFGNQEARYNPGSSSARRYGGSGMGRGWGGY